jgi:hypothetical protein
VGVEYGLGGGALVNGKFEAAIFCGGLKIQGPAAAAAAAARDEIFVRETLELAV